MKRLLLFLLTSCFFSGIAQYRKMPLDTGMYWQQHLGRVGNMSSDFWDCYIVLRITGDSTWNGKIFKKVFGQSTRCNNAPQGGYGIWGLLREDTVKRIVTRVFNSQEKILFNFNKTAGDTAALLNESMGGTVVYTVTTRDSLLLGDGKYHRRLMFSPAMSMVTLIEGVGSLGGLLQNWSIDFEHYSTLLCAGRFSPALSLYSSAGQGSSCPDRTGIQEITRGPNRITVGPSPADDYVQVKIQDGNFQGIRITNVFGLTVREIAHDPQTELMINVADLPAGLYIMSIRDGAVSGTTRFVKN